MFNVNNAPVTTPQLISFAQVVAREMDRLRLDPQAVELVVAAEAGDAVAFVVGHTNDLAATTAHIDQLFATRRRMAATASLVGWAPDPDTPTTPAWLLIAVGIGGLPAVAAVRRIEEDDRWWQLASRELPWVALSTAAGLRAVLEQAAPLRLKSASGAALFEPPSVNPSPPLDERGEL